LSFVVVFVLPEVDDLDESLSFLESSTFSNLPLDLPVELLGLEEKPVGLPAFFFII
jgi:hypothetical protein